MRVSSDKTANRLDRRLLRMHINDTTEGADIALPGDSKANPPGLVLLWLLTVVGLLLYLFAIS